MSADGRLLAALMCVALFGAACWASPQSSAPPCTLRARLTAQDRELSKDALASIHLIQTNDWRKASTELKTADTLVHSMQNELSQQLPSAASKLHDASIWLENALTGLSPALEGASDPQSILQSIGYAGSSVNAAMTAINQSSEIC